MPSAPIARRECPDCGRLYPGDERYCSADGTELETVEVRDKLVGTTLASRFRVQELLTTGGMGRIYRAEQMSISRTVAIKVLHPSHATEATSVARFEREARAVAGLQSPHTVRIHDFGQAESGELFMVMELLSGRTLREELAERGSLPPGEVAAVLDAVARSLGEAHAAGIVHRDLTPANIFLSRTHDYDAFVKVLDFGIAAWLDDQTPRLTRGSGVVGTPAYVAPERIGGADPTPASDIYALGVMAYECLTGRPPFAGTTAEELFEHHLRAHPEPLPAEVPAALGALVLRCLGKSPRLRPGDGDAFRESLRAAMEGPEVDLAVTGEARTPRPAPPEAVALDVDPDLDLGLPRRRLWPGLAAGVAAAAAVVALVAWSSAGGPEAPAVKAPAAEAAPVRPAPLGESAPPSRSVEEPRSAAAQSAPESREAVETAPPEEPTEATAETATELEPAPEGPARLESEPTGADSEPATAPEPDPERRPAPVTQRKRTVSAKPQEPKTQPVTGVPESTREKIDSFLR